MKKRFSALILVVIILSLCACSESKNNPAEVNEVKSYLKQYYWYRYAGGTFEQEIIYDFRTDGTYTMTAFHSFPYLDFSHEGTYQINTNRRTLMCVTDEGKEYEWTYSLYENSMKLIDSYSNEYTKINKK